MTCAWNELLSILPLRMRREVDELGKSDAQQIYLRLDSRPELIVKYDINQDGTPDTLKPYDESTKTGDYIVTGYGNNLRPGTNKGTITIKGMGEFGGTVTLKFTIQPKAMQW